MLLTRITPAYFSALQDQPAALKRYLLRLTEILVHAALFPILIGFALMADPIVRLALGPKWLGAIGPLRLLAISAAINSTIPPARKSADSQGPRPATCCGSGASLRSCCRSRSSSAASGDPLGIAAVWVTVFPITRIPMLQRAWWELSGCP